MIKNTASQHVGAQMVSATDGSAFTGAVTVSVTGDAGAQATGSVGSGACTHEGNGYHTYAPAQAETNYNLVAFTFTGTGAIPVTVQIYTITGDSFARLGAPAGASVSADIAAVKVDTAAILDDTGTSGVALADNSITAAKIADNAIDRATFAADTGLQPIRSNTAAAGSSSTITLDGSASATSSIYNNNLIVLTGGTGAGQVRVITAYNGGTKVATVSPNWVTQPDNTSTFAIKLFSNSVQGIVNGVWDENVGSHAIAASTGQVLNATQDITADTGALINATLGTPAGASMSADIAAISAKVDTVDDFLDTEVAAIKAKTDQLTFTTANKIDARTFTNDDKTGYTVANGGIAAASFAAGAIDAAAIAANAIGAAELAQDAAREIADEVLDRDIAGSASGGARNVRSALRRLRNKVAISAGTATVYQEDDSTSAWTAAVTTAAGNPVSSVDPA